MLISNQIKLLQLAKPFNGNKMCKSYVRAREFQPGATRKIFRPNPNKKKLPLEKRPPPRAPAYEIHETGLRVNELNIQMLSRDIFRQVFPTNIGADDDANKKCNPLVLEQCARDLAKHDMVTRPEDYTPDVSFKIPPLCGENIEQHFYQIAQKQLQPYSVLIDELLKKPIPQLPAEWVMQVGWTRYEPGASPQSVPYPLEPGLVFDVEVCMRAGKAPTLATCVSSVAWYGWVSQSLIDGTNRPVTTHQYPINCLIPMESSETDTGLVLSEFMRRPKVVIGHNVSYDRARIKEQYWLPRTGTRFVDTMSLHVSVSGLTSYQRAVLKSGTGKMLNGDDDDEWVQYGSLNSLIEVYKLYCGSQLSKSTRDLFVEGTLGDIQGEFQKVMRYCSGDVTATFNVMTRLYPIFTERFPHPATLGGMLELGTAYLPVNDNWNRYITNSEQAYEDMDTESRVLLARRADQACQLTHDDNYARDLWLWDQDWEVKQLKTRKTKSSNTAEHKNEDEKGDEDDPLESKFNYLRATRDLLSTVNSHLPGYPKWYRKLCTKPDSTPDWVPGPNLISTSMKITPKLLALTWEGYPLHHLKDKGWGFLVPYTDDLSPVRKLPLRALLDRCPLVSTRSARDSTAPNDISAMVQDNLMRKEFYSRVKSDRTDGLYRGSGIWCSTEVEDCCFFLKLPHKDGPTYNVGNPLSKDFLNKFSENVLAGEGESTEQVLTIARMLSYWRNNRARIYDQMVVWLGGETGGGAIVPQVVVCGTLTRRAVERTWMTASNAHPERIGSELRAMVQAPAGYRIVGADVDSQELWISSVIGDAHRARAHGATPFGWMTLGGDKAHGTDMHSVTARAVGISRDHAKVMNYARIYGGGQNFAERLLRQFNPSMCEGEARAKANKMFALTKGKRIFVLKEEHRGSGCLPDQPYSKWQAFEMAKAHGKPVGELFRPPKWVGGTESAMFNRLEEIASGETPRTPFLGARLSRALEPKSQDDRFLPTRVNWVVQSGAVDFLHLMLVSMRHIMGDRARFCLSFHDEVRYLVPDEFQYQAALAMHVTNLWTRAFCSARLGIHDLPQSVAFFSSVEIDTVLRKESQHDCKTPSNPRGLLRGYDVANGESLNVHEAIELARGKSTSWYERLGDHTLSAHSNYCICRLRPCILTTPMDE